MNHLIALREWMYNQRVPGRSYNNDAYMAGVLNFIEMARSRGCVSEGNQLRCPCSRCKNKKYRNVELVEEHLYRNGFVPNYYNWTSHGEPLEDWTNANEPNLQNTTVPPPEIDATNNMFFQQMNVDSNFDAMIRDFAGPSNFPDPVERNVNFAPDPAALNYLNLWRHSGQPAFDGCDTETELSIAMKLLQHKNDNNITEKAYDEYCSINQRLHKPGNKLPTSFKNTKKLLNDIGLSMERIDCCVDGCMIYYKEDENLTSCKFCDEPRFHAPLHGSESNTYKRKARKSMFYLPIIPRLQRLFMAPSTAEHMTWHATRRGFVDKMVHPCDGESWKFFDQCYPQFASDPRNVRLGLCSDGFSPYGMSAKSHSCWPVMMTAYNLPPWMCMKSRFIWLTIMIPGPSSPKKRIDVFLRPLIDDLVTLWNVGVDTYDSHKQEFFRMRAALLWTISDFPAYGMLSGWSTAGRLGCPYCMESTKTFWLPNGRKHSYFDCHRRFLPTNHPYRYDVVRFRKNLYELDPPINLQNGHQIYGRVRHFNYVSEMHPDETTEGFGETHNWTKKSIFWMLPYWINVLLRHNLDVMHIEKNVFENLFNTIMDVTGKTKDTGVRTREDVKLFCDRPTLHTERRGNKMIARRAKYQLKVEQQRAVLGWITSLRFPDGYGSRLGRHVNMETRRLVGYKTHDAHVFIERLMAIAFRGFLPKGLWEAVSEIATFFRDICGSSLNINLMRQWQRNIVETLCKLEMFFPPSFFDSMEHLPIHVAEEMVLGGPVQYRWMYPFERFIYRLKKLARNRSKPEASIVNAYLQQEVSFYGSDYLGPEFKTNAKNPKRNEVLQSGDEVSIYNYPGKGGSVVRKRNLSEQEYVYATYYILNNTPELEDYIRMFDQTMGVTTLEFKATHFGTWLQHHVMTNVDESQIPAWLLDVIMGFQTRVSCYKSFKVNNYRFSTEEHSENRPTVNCQVHVLAGNDTHFYGVIEEIIHMHTRRNRTIGIVLFKCRWFDPVHYKCFPSNGITEVNTQRLYTAYDPFILAQQGNQVYYTYFPGMPNRSERGWTAVCRMKPTNTIDMHTQDVPFQNAEGINEPLPVVGILSTQEPLADETYVNEYAILTTQDHNADIEYFENEEEDDDDEWDFDDDESTDESN